MAIVVRPVATSRIWISRWLGPALSIKSFVRSPAFATDNTISYDKIAEARISYGGRGRITEIQQPGWGHQLFDLISPF